MNELKTLELNDEELMGVVGGGCRPDYCEPRCEPHCCGVSIEIDINVALCL